MHGGADKSKDYLYSREKRGALKTHSLFVKFYTLDSENKKARFQKDRTRT